MSLENKQFGQSGGSPEITIAFFSYSQEAIDVFKKAQESKLRLNHKTLGIEHMLIGTMQSPMGSRVFEDMFNCDVDHIAVAEKQIAEMVKGRNVEETGQMSEEGRQAILIAAEEAKREGTFQITDQHLLKAIMKTENNTAAQILGKIGIDTDQIIKRLSSPQV